MPGLEEWLSSAEAAEVPARARRRTKAEQNSAYGPLRRTLRFPAKIEPQVQSRGLLRHSVAAEALDDSSRALIPAAVSPRSSSVAPCWRSSRPRQARSSRAQAGQAPAGQRGGGQGRGGRGGGVPVDQNGECPPGMTEWRAGSCRAPNFPRPASSTTGRDRRSSRPSTRCRRRSFRPSTSTAIRRARSASAESLDRAHRQARRDQRRRVRQPPTTRLASGSCRTLDVVRNSPYKDRVRVFTGVSFNGVGPGWAEKAVAQLEADVKAGAVGVGEDRQGPRPDDAESRRHRGSPWTTGSRSGLGGLRAAEHPGRSSTRPSRRSSSSRPTCTTSAGSSWRSSPIGATTSRAGPTFEQLMTRARQLFRRHPKTRFIAAHFGWHANDLARAAKLLDAFPNVLLEVGAVLYDLGRQPRAAREFFMKYQDRILFGKDSFEPSEFPYYWRVFETNDEYFDYYRDYHAFWKLYGMGLPDAVLKKIYYQNALKGSPGLPQTGWPKIGHTRVARYVVTGGAGFIGSHLVEDCSPRRSRSASPTISRPAAGRTFRRRASASWSKATSSDAAVARRAVAGLRVRHPPGRDSLGAAVGGGPRDLASRQRRRHARRSSSPRATPGSSGSSSPARRRCTATRRSCPSARTCRPTRSRRTRSRSSSASSTARCSRGSTGSRR